MSEPQRRGGVRAATPEFLHAARKLCDERGVRFTQVFLRISGHAEKGIVGFHNLVSFGEKDPDNVGIHQSVCPLLALAQGFLRPFLLVDIGDSPKPLDDLAGVIAHRRPAR